MEAAVEGSGKEILEGQEWRKKGVNKSKQRESKREREGR